MYAGGVTDKNSTTYVYIEQSIIKCPYETVVEGFVRAYVWWLSGSEGGCFPVCKKKCTTHLN